MGFGFWPNPLTPERPKGHRASVIRRAKLGVMGAKDSKPKDIELVPDAWPRFERFISDIAKAGPQHRPSKPKADKAKSPKKRKGEKA